MNKVEEDKLRCYRMGLAVSIEIIRGLLRDEDSCIDYEICGEVQSIIRVEYDKSDEELLEYIKYVEDLGFV